MAIGGEGGAASIENWTLSEVISFSWIFGTSILVVCGCRLTIGVDSSTTSFGADLVITVGICAGTVRSGAVGATEPTEVGTVGVGLNDAIPTVGIGVVIGCWTVDVAPETFQKPPIF